MPLARPNKEAAQDLLNLLHGLPNPVAVFSAGDGQLLAANAHFCKVLDLPEKESAQITKTGFGKVADAQNQFQLRIIDETIAHFVSPSGTRPIVDAGMQPIRLNGRSCLLITPAGQALQSPRGQGAVEPGHYRALLENLNEIIYINDKNANVVYVSPNICRLTGYEAHEVIGKSITQFVHPDDLEGALGIFLKILEGEEQVTEFRMITRTSEIKWFRTDARPVMRHGEVVGVQGALIDVTERKAVEDALKHSEEKYRNVVENARDAIFVTQDNYFRFMNPSTSELLGCAHENIVERPFWDFIHPDDREMMEKRYRRRLAGKSIPNNVFFRAVNRDGDVRDVELNAVLIDWEGKPAVLNFLRDITVQKKMENQLRNAQKLEALGTLSGGIAHNFNNLLMGIHGNVSLSMTELAPSTRAYKNMEKIASLVQSGSKLTRQLLEYARGRVGEMATVDLKRLVQEASDTIAATQKQIKFRFGLSSDDQFVKADQGQIEQVLLNLLLNAADAMPDGGEVFVETACLKGAHAEEKNTLSKSTDYAMVKISDQGGGIPPKILDRIFEPFFTTKGLGQGSGLGLSTAYGIVKNHQGDIFVESQIGKGSTFSIYLPLLSADSVWQSDKLSSRNMAGYGTVLLVDDEFNVLHPIGELLEHLGFSIFRAINGSVAVEIFKKEKENIDLVILDLIMPGISGKDLYYRLKAIDPQVKVVISSGYSQDGQAAELISHGCLGFIQKPFDISELSAMIMQIISG